MGDSSSPYMLTQMVGGAPGPGSALVDLREVVIVEPLVSMLVHLYERGVSEKAGLVPVRRRWSFLIHLRGIPTALTCFVEPPLNSGLCNMVAYESECERLTRELRTLFTGRIQELRA